MRSRNRKRREGILIDLTSLLDVIFILLLVVLCGGSVMQEQVQKEAENAIDEAEQAKEYSEEKTQAYSDMLDAQNSLQQFVWVASVSAPYDSNDFRIRHVMIVNEEKEDLFEIDLVGNDVREQMKELQDQLSKYAQDHAGYPVIISFNENDDKILYRDEVEISKVLDDLRSTYDNVYIK